MRHHDPDWLRADLAWLDWQQIARTRLEKLGEPVDRHQDELARLKRHGPRLHLLWAIAPEVGAPRGPFRIWARTPTDQREDLRPAIVTGPEGQTLSWGGRELTTLQVDVQVLNPSLPVALHLLRTGETSEARGILGSDARIPGGAGILSLRARAPFATMAVLENARVLAASATWLDDVLADDGWKPVEDVGLCVSPREIPDYASEPQGLLEAPTGGVQAAHERIKRAGPPLGWWPRTEAGAQAPTWRPPDPGDLVEGLRKHLIPQIAPVFAVPEPAQARQVRRHRVEGPQQDGRRYDHESATLELPLLRSLLLTAATDVYSALALGFATGYAGDELPTHPLESEFLVTAHYSELPDGQRDVDLAAYLPQAEPHTAAPAVVDLRSRRGALTPPAARDGAWRDSVVLSWQAEPATAVLTQTTSSAALRYEPGGSNAVELLAPDIGGGSGLQLATASPETTGPDLHRDTLVEKDLDLPHTGTLDRGYAVSRVNLFGVFSRWRDVDYTGQAPAPEGPRVVDVRAEATFTGSTLCPATTQVEVAVPWVDRTPVRVELLAVTYPMATAGSAPPAVDPLAPPVGHATATITFSGDEPVTVTPGASVVGLDRAGVELTRTPVPDGEDPPAVPPPPRPAGTATQGDAGRRYRITFPVGAMQFAGVSRWGVRVFARLRVVGHPAPTAYSPRPQDPATAVVASPVPHVPVPPPLPPDVPLGSTPDDRGRSHVSVVWADPGTPQVHRMVVWETSESVLRSRFAADQVPGPTPGHRLQQLWDLYDALPAASRQLAFRRHSEVPRQPTRLDVALPRGSRDIHLFLVTTVTTTGLASPWPGGAVPHAHLQAAIAPTVRRPDPPVVRPVVTPGGIDLEVECASAVPVSAFEVLATRSEIAARDHLTMGPPRASLPAAPTGEVDVVTGSPVYAANDPVPLPPSWDPWYVAAVAAPVTRLGPEAVLGTPSAPSPVLPVFLPPPDAPDLDPLTVSVSDDGHQVRVRSASAAPAREVPAGSHRLAVLVDGVASEPAPARLEDLPERPLGHDPAVRPLLARAPRSGGETPLTYWFTRADRTRDVEVTMRLTDPLGRVTERAVTVLAWREPVPRAYVEIRDVFRISGRGVSALIATSMPAKGDVAMRVVAKGRGVLRPPLGRPVLIEETFRLVDLPRRRLGRPAKRVDAVRMPDEAGERRIALWIGAEVTTVRVEIGAPRHLPVSDTWTA